jgi:hypothetical protein
LAKPRPSQPPNITAAENAGSFRRLFQKEGALVTGHASKLRQISMFQGEHLLILFA